MISNFDEINELFKEINNSVSDKINIYVIGGAMLLYHGLKPATKDIDVIVFEKSEYTLFGNALTKIGFEPKVLTNEYKHLNLNEILVRDDFRVDLFHKIVCKGFSLTDTMISRAEPIIELSKLKVFLCSNEDVFLFKTLTEREGDLEDCIAISRRGLNWNEILTELKLQIDISKRNVWITYVGERLDILEERGMIIPIMKEIDKLRTEYYEKLEKKFISS